MPQFVDIIFLDIDGVLLPFGGSTTEQSSDRKCRTTQGCIFPDCTMDALTSLLDRANHISLGNDDHASPSSACCCKIVLSSTWRARSDFIQDILDSFRAYATEKARTDPTIMPVWESHLDSFFDITDPNLHSTRHDEIYHWVHTHEQNLNQANTNNAHNTTQDYIVRSWIALDDEDLVNVEGRVSQDAKDHAVLIQSSVGLTHKDVSFGMQLLEQQYQRFYSKGYRR
jgi:hypothetical protein